MTNTNNHWNLTKTFAERLEVISKEIPKNRAATVPLTEIGRSGRFVYFYPAEIRTIKKAAKYMNSPWVMFLTNPTYGYRILSHIERGSTVEEASELYGKENWAEANR